MIYFFIAIDIIYFLFCKKKKKILTDPGFIFLTEWIVILLFNKLALYDLYIPSDRAIGIINLGIISFLIGYFLFKLIYNSKHNNTINKDNSKLNKVYYINKNKMYILFVILFVFLFIKMIDILPALIKGMNFNELQESLRNSTDSTAIDRLLYNFVLLPSLYAIPAIVAADYYFGEKNKSMFFLTILLIAMSSIVFAARTPIITFIIYMVVGYLFTNKNKIKNHKMINTKNIKFIILIVMIVALLVLITISRSPTGVFRMVYLYLAMPPTLFSKWIEIIDQSGLYTYGFSALNGVFFSINFFIKNLFRLDSYVPVVENGYNFISSTVSNWIQIKPGATTANAYVTMFSFFYADLRIIGVCIGSVIFGVCCSWLYKKINNNFNIKIFAIFLLVFQSILYTPIRFFLVKPYYFIAIIIIVFAFSKKSKERS